MPKERDPNHVPSVRPQAKKAIAFMIEQKADLAAAALYAGMAVRELRRQLSQPHVRRYALEQRQIALEAFCLGSPAALQKVRDESENGIAVVNAVKAGEQLRVGAVHDEASAEKRMPGLQIVIVQQSGERELVPMPSMPMMLDVTPAEAVPMPSDAEAE
jgi:hypothetical protein